MALHERQRNPLGRGVALLTKMVELDEPSYGVHALAGEMELPASSVHRLLTLLEESGMVAQTPTGQYQLGLDFYRLAWRASSQQSIRRLAMPLLQEAARETGEATVLGLYEPSRGQMMFVARYESRYAVQHLTPLDEWIPIYTGASGLVILAEVPDEQRERIVRETGLRPLAKNTIRDPVTLDRELARIRRDGFAITHSQRADGAVGTAAAFFGADDAVLGCILLTVPEQRHDPANESWFSRVVLRTADRLSELLGSRRAARWGGD